MRHQAFGGAAMIGWGGVVAVAVPLAEPSVPGGGTDHTNLWFILLACLAVGIVGAIGFWITREASVDGKDGQEMKDAKDNAAQVSGNANQTTQGQGHVVSYNQSGGITAGHVQIGAMQRTLGGVPPEIIKRLQVFAGTKFDTQNANDGESARYEGEIRRFLAAADWVPSGTGFYTSNPAIFGLWIHAPEAATAAAQELQRCLNELGLQAGITAKRVGGGLGRRGDEPQPEGNLQITVALRP